MKHHTRQILDDAQRTADRIDAELASACLLDAFDTALTYVRWITSEFEPDPEADAIELRDAMCGRDSWHGGSVNTIHPMFELIDDDDWRNWEEFDTAFHWSPSAGTFTASIYIDRGAVRAAALSHCEPA